VQYPCIATLTSCRSLQQLDRQEPGVLDRLDPDPDSEREQVDPDAAVGQQGQLPGRLFSVRRFVGQTEAREPYGEGVCQKG
jgi:hypothetical protein